MRVVWWLLPHPFIEFPFVFDLPFRPKVLHLFDISLLIEERKMQAKESLKRQGSSMLQNVNAYLQGITQKSPLLLLLFSVGGISNHKYAMLRHLLSTWIVERRRRMTGSCNFRSQCTSCVALLSSTLITFFCMTCGQRVGPSKNP